MAHLHGLLKRKLAAMDTHRPTAAPGGGSGSADAGSAAAGAGSSQSRLALLLAFGQGARASLRLHRASPWAAVASPLVMLPALGTAVLATRGLVDGGGHGLDAGGLGWAVDLTVADPTLALPLLAVASTYLNLELSLGARTAAHAANNASAAPLQDSPREGNAEAGSNGNGTAPPATAAGSALHPAAAAADRSGGDASLVAGPPSSSAPASTGASRADAVGVMGLVKDGLQTVLICGLPLVAALPAGAFAFWLASSAWTTAQTVGLRHPEVRRALGLKAAPGTQPSK